MSGFDLAAYQAAELRLHEAAVEYAQAPTGQPWGNTLSKLLSAALDYAKVVPDLSFTEQNPVALQEFRTRVDNGWVPFGWHMAYPTVRLEFDGTGWHLAYPTTRLEFDGQDECGNPVWERNAAWGLSVTEKEADRNAEEARRCADLTKSPRGWLQCQLPAGHEADPRSLHHVDPAGPVITEADREARGES